MRQLSQQKGNYELEPYQANRIYFPLPLEGIIINQRPQRSEQQIIFLIEGEIFIFEQIKQEKLYFNGVKELLKTKTKKISQSMESRIYHTIANIKKDRKVDLVEKNQFKLITIKQNSYKQLNEQELEEIVRYEKISSIVLRETQKLQFVFRSAQGEYKRLITLLNELFRNQINFNLIKGLKYDLEASEIKKIAALSRKTCEHYENGVYLLLVYFFKAAKYLESKGSPSEEIQSRLHEAIQNISQLYPPGSGLQVQDLRFYKTLKELQNQKNYNKVSFQHSPHSLTSNNKQEQVERIITRYASIAQKNKPVFQELLTATCVQKCIYYKVGLKLYPDNPNPKAMTRIKEKMFFKKSEQEIKEMKGSIQEILNKQEKDYLQKINVILQAKNEVEFKITDMVRGKCVFLKIQEIIDAVNEIKRFVANDKRFQISQIESRFTNTIPISDVTLKIVINREIVAELQLTIQTNAAAYTFAHKVYELQRTKVFSKLKITNNYFEEYKQDFNELVTQTLALMKSDQKGFLTLAISFFEISSTKPKSFKQLFTDRVKEDKRPLPKLKYTVEPNLQNLMLPLMYMQMGRWDKDIGMIINQKINNQELSPKLKAALLCSFFEKFGLEKQSVRMSQYGFLREKIQQNKIVYMVEYLRQFFQIENAFDYIAQSHRIFHRGKQLLQICFDQFYEGAQNCLKETNFVKNLVYEQDGQHKVEHLSQFVHLYFGVRSETINFYREFQLYYKWLLSILNNNPRLDPHKSKQAQLKLLYAIYSLQKNMPNGVDTILNELKTIFQVSSQYQNSLLCDLLKLEWFSKTRGKQQPVTVQEQDESQDEQIIIHEKQQQGKIVFFMDEEQQQQQQQQQQQKEQSQQQKNAKREEYERLQASYKDIKKREETLGILLKGPKVAMAKWRFLSNLLSNYKVVKQRILKEIAPDVIEELSRSTGKQFIYALKKIGEELQANSIDYRIEQNERIIYVKLQKVEEEGSRCLTNSKWPNLKVISLYGNKIGAVGCSNLKQIEWQHLQQLNLYDNNVEYLGCEHLAKASWKQMKIFNLGNNNIGDKGCEFLKNGEWSNLSQLNLASNKIGAIGCKYLKQSRWKQLTVLNLDSDDIGASGCQHLARADWKLLTTLTLWNSSIGPVGCENLRKANWKHLSYLRLACSVIGDKGCEQLSKADWRQLATLELWGNNIGDVGCGHLSRANWKQLKTLELSRNSIGPLGCESFSKADWRQLTTLNLSGNSIGDVGCSFLRKASWKHLRVLKLQGNKIQSAGCEQLCKADWKDLATLNLDYNRIGDNGCKCLANTSWSQLNILFLAKNQITAFGCQFLKSAPWSKLQQLNMRNNNIGDEGCRHLSQTGWKSLRNLNLSENKIGLGGCEHLSKNAWPWLKYMFMGQNMITKSARKMLRTCFSQEELIIYW